MSELRIKNRSERDLRGYEVTQAVTNKAQNKFWGVGALFVLTAYVTSQLRRPLSLLFESSIVTHARTIAVLGETLQKFMAPRSKLPKQMPSQENLKITSQNKACTLGSLIRDFRNFQH